MSRRALVTGLALATMVFANESHAQSTAASTGTWYRKSRALEITGANPRDSVVLTALGKRADSLSISMAFYVGGVVKHRQRWPSEDELYDNDELKKSPAKLNAFMRRRLDDILTMVKRDTIDRELVKHMGDEAMLRRIAPRPTHQVMFSFAFETSTFLVWDPVRRRLRVFMECC
ncbi:MAG: hypothetical protein ABMA00_04815 [Gemmatimonas sp.]